MPVTKPIVKNKARQKTIQEELKGWGDEWKQKIAVWVNRWQKSKDIIKNNYELGRSHMQRGNIQDAILRFKFVLWLDPKHADALYSLGCSYIINGKTALARDAFSKVLKLKSGNEEARYLLAIASGSSMPKSELPKKIPLSIIQEQFESMAPTFSSSQLEQYKYEGHALLCNAVRSALVPGKVDHIILEPGVGTGLCGPLLRDVAANITGVDFSQAMLAEAMKVMDDRGRKIYDSLVKREAQEFLNDAPDNGYDIVIAAGLVSYLGDLEHFFEQSTRILKKGGVLAFTADKQEGEGYEFNAATGRFGFSQSYLTGLATKYNLQEFRCKEAKVYPEFVGWLCVFRK
jgi:predicted TPR repeat methyltransferase